MNEELAAIYGTGNTGHDEEDFVKQASAELLVKLAEEEGVDLNDFSDEDIAGMLTELENGEEAGGSEGEEKLAEADYLGRVMAHAMVQELDKVAAEGEVAAEKGPGIFRRGYSGAKSGVVGGAKHQGRAFSQLGRGARDLVTSAGKGRRGASALEALKGLGKSAPSLAGGAAAAYGGYRGVKHLLNKKSSALGGLAEERAYEILAETGWVDNSGDVIDPGYAKEASPLAEAVEGEAMAILEEAGYPVQW